MICTMRSIFVSVLSAVLFVQASPLLANPIYVFKEKDGSVRFTTKAPSAGVKAEVFSARRGSFAYYRGGGYRRFFSGGKLSRRYWDVIERASRLYSLERNLIQAVIHVESYFDPLAVSPKGARGLMQLMPDTARMLRVRNSFGVEENIMGGSRYLSFLLRKYQGNVKLALAAYNAGEASVEKFNGIPPYRETVDYVDRVLRMRKRYELIANG